MWEEYWKGRFFFCVRLCREQGGGADAIGFQRGMKMSVPLSEGQKGLDSQVGAGHVVCAEETKWPSLPSRRSEPLLLQCPEAISTGLTLCHITGMREMLRKFSSKSAWFVDPLGTFRWVQGGHRPSLLERTEALRLDWCLVWLCFLSESCSFLCLHGSVLFIPSPCTCTHTDLLRGFCVAPSVLVRIKADLNS